MMDSTVHEFGIRLTVLSSIWRILNGPNTDWPLAVCDYTTLDLDDIETIDYIGRDFDGGTWTQIQP